MTTKHYNRAEEVLIDLRRALIRAQAEKRWQDATVLLAQVQTASEMMDICAASRAEYERDNKQTNKGE